MILKGAWKSIAPKLTYEEIVREIDLPDKKVGIAMLQRDGIGEYSPTETR